MPCCGGERDDLLDRLQGADLVVGPHHRDQRRPTPGRARQPRAARRRRAARLSSTGSSSTSASSASRSQCSGSSTAWCSTAVARMRVRRGSSAQPRPVDALDREVVGLGAAGGEHHLARAAVERLRDRLAGLLDDPPGVSAGRVQRARVADLEQVRRHRLDRRGHHRRGGGVVEVDRAVGDVHSLPSVRRGRDVPVTAEGGPLPQIRRGYLRSPIVSRHPDGRRGLRRPLSRSGGRSRSPRRGGDRGPPGGS